MDSQLSPYILYTFNNDNPHINQTLEIKSQQITYPHDSTTPLSS